jgi:pimeloyl-ACP methyl ester carboxylesterase
MLPWTGLSPRRRLLLGAVALLLVALVATLVVRVVKPGRPVAAPPRPGPVLLVPGYGGGRESLSVLAGRIRATGRTAEVLTLPGDGTGDLVVQAEALAAAVARAVAGGAGSVDVIGYSAGGVVAWVWATRHGGAQLARRVVTLGAPMHGARLAALASWLGSGICPPACQQLVPGSGLLAELDREPVPAGLGWLSLWTANDETVTPPDSARLAGATNVELQSVCPDEVVRHGELPTDPLVTGLVLRAIAAGPLLPPTRADCTALRRAGG